MFALRALRRLTAGMPCMLIAALMLAARLLAPAGIAVAAPVDVPFAGLSVICHAGGEDGQTPAHGQSCTLCPACTLQAQAWLPAPLPPFLPASVRGVIGRAAPPPAARGPPHQPRLAAHPTGPPPAAV